MSQGIINEHTDKNIKDYLSVENNSDKSNVSAEEIMADLGDKKAGNDSKNKKFLFVVLLIVVSAVLTLAYFMFMDGQNSFDNSKVKIEIETPAEITSGEEFVVNIKYENNTGVKLKNVKITLSVPKEFVFTSSDRSAVKNPDSNIVSWSLSDLPSGKSEKIKLFGKIMGEKDSGYYFSSKIVYIPENFNYEFVSSDENSGKASLKITLIPFELSIESPEAAISDSEINYSIYYKNISSRTYKNVRVKVLLSEGLNYLSSQPEPNEKGNNYFIWSAEKLDSNIENKISFKSNVKGTKGDKRIVKVSLEASENEEILIGYLNKEAQTEIQEAPIVLSQAINGTVDYSAVKGEELEYKIKFKNISDKEIKGLVINNEISGSIDLNSLKVNNGSYDDKYKITWSAFNVPKLAVIGPQEEDEVSFKVNIKNYIDIKDNNDKNFIIKNKASISSFNFNSDSVDLVKTITENESTVKIKASMLVNMKGYFNDDGRIANTGTIPPEVGKETAYNIHWNLSSLFNDVKNVRVIAVLPEHAKWKGNYIKPNGEKSLGGENNGVVFPETIDSGSISAINGGLGESKTEVVYNWYDNTIYNNEKDKGLPQNLKAGDTLEFTYDDGNVRETDSCLIQENPSYQGHYYFCSIPWKINIPVYDERKNYRIKKAFASGVESFFYDPQTRQVVWEIPRLDANTGIISPAKEVVFQIGVTPAYADVGKTIKIIDKIDASGYDDFTNSRLSVLNNGLTSELPDDESVGIEEGIVMPPSNFGSSDIENQNFSSQ